MRRLFLKSRIRKPASLAMAYLLIVFTIAPAALAGNDKNDKDKKDQNEESNKDKYDNPADIGDRDVSGHVNFYSLEKEIALGKQTGAGSRAPIANYQRSGSRRVCEPHWPEPSPQL